MTAGKEDTLRRMAARFADDERGGVAIEYGLIASLIFLAIVGSMQVLSGNLMTNFWNKISNAMANTPGS